MGWVAHDVAIVTTWFRPDEERPDMDAFRATLPERWRPLVVGPVPGVVNEYVTYAFLPDGSKEGWDDSVSGDHYREQFLALFTRAYEDGSSPDDVVEVRFGEDHEREYGASVAWRSGNRKGVRGGGL